MQVIVIVEHGNDWPIAAIKIPEGKTDDETFIMWYRSENPNYDISDQDILEEPYLWQELTVEQVS